MKAKLHKGGGEVVKMTIYIPEDVHRELRHLSVDEGRSATEIIRELVKEYLEKNRARKGGKSK